MGFSRLALKLDSQNSFGDEHTATVRALSYCCLYLFFRVHSKPVEHEHEKLPKVKALVGSIPDLILQQKVKTCAEVWRILCINLLILEHVKWVYLN